MLLLLYNVGKGKLDIQVYNSSLLTEVVGIQLHTIYVKLSLDKNSPSPATYVSLHSRKSGGKNFSQRGKVSMKSLVQEKD